MLRLPRAFLDEMVAHARQEDPNEACGVLAGKDGLVKALFRVTNVERSPYRYLMDPKEQYQALKACDAQGWEVLAFYHSHTHTEAYPSATDIRLAASWPDPLYVIVSLMDREAPVVRAFSLREGKPLEMHLLVEDPS